MNHRKSSMGRSRDFGIPAVGKGDKSRVSDQAEYLRNLDEVVFPDAAPEGFKKVGHKSIKKYGN